MKTTNNSIDKFLEDVPTISDKDIDKDYRNKYKNDKDFKELVDSNSSD